MSLDDHFGDDDGLMAYLFEGIDSISNAYGTSYPLHHSCRIGDINAIIRHVKQNKISLHETDYDRLTPLHICCLGGYISCVSWLVQHDADVNASSIDGSTPLCYACAAGHVECAQILLSHGALVNPPNCLSTPLHDAAFGGKLECLELLIQAGARLNEHDCHFGTPLHAAAHQNHDSCIRALLLAGSHINAIKFHETPLHLAVSMNHIESVNLLILFGANVFAKNNRDKRPIELVKDPSGAVYAALDCAQKVVPSLQDLCRRVARENRFIAEGKCNDLPQYLIQFIKYQR